MSDGTRANHDQSPSAPPNPCARVNLEEALGSTPVRSNREQKRATRSMAQALGAGPSIPTSKDLAQRQMTAHPSRAGPPIPTAVCLADP